MNHNSPLPMLAVLYGSAFVAAFNENTINVALVSIMSTFAIDANTAQWLVTGYMIVTAIVVTTTAFLSKRLPLRTLFLAAAAFLVGGLAASIVVYGGVGLVMSPSQTAGLQTLLPRQHPHGVAILNTFIQIAASIGPSLFIGVLSAVAADAQAQGTAANVAQASGFTAAVAVACAIAALGTVLSLTYSLKRRRLAREMAAAPEAEARPSEAPQEA